jgi:uncharacterized protein (TIGR02186 family)
VVATIIGPRRTLVVWRKERIAGVWVNGSSRTFVEPPSFLSIVASRPFDTIAAPAALRRQRIGLRNFPFPQKVQGDIGELGPDDPYRQALVDLKVDQLLYRERTNGVTFLTPALFRATIPLPAAVPIGEYEVEAKLFAGGAMVASETSAFEIIKTGAEQFIANTARNHSLLYGLATTALALMTGWLGSVLFRRD